MTEQDTIQHYNRLIQTTEEEIAKKRMENVHFSKIEEDLDYLAELNRRKQTLEGKK